MTIAAGSVLVTGANRGIGQALVEEALRRGAQIFRDPMSESMAEIWRSDAANALERQNAAFVQAEPATS